MHIPNNNLRMLATATLIRRFHERCPLDELYDKAVRSYENLIDAIEDKHTAGEIAAILNIPEITVKDYAEAIINILLFNKESDPFLSFGLRKDTSISEVNRRWKRLIVLYHPDRFSNQDLIGEKAKKINEMHAKIQEMRERDAYSVSFNALRGMSLQRNRNIPHRTYLKYIPTIIVALAVILAVLSIMLFLLKR